jgi:ferritin-like metal-binding protein YciE
LVAKLPEIARHVHYHDLREGIQDTVSDVEKQMARVELVLTLLDGRISAENCAGMVGMIDEAFLGIKRNTGKDHGLRDLSIAYYAADRERGDVVLPDIRDGFR